MLLCVAHAPCYKRRNLIMTMGDGGPSLINIHLLWHFVLLLYEFIHQVAHNFKKKPPSYDIKIFLLFCKDS